MKRKATTSSIPAKLIKFSFIILVAFFILPIEWPKVRFFGYEEFSVMFFVLAGLFLVAIIGVVLKFVETLARIKARIKTQQVQPAASASTPDSVSPVTVEVVQADAPSANVSQSSN